MSRYLFEIESGIPMPRKRGSKYPWAAMKIGDSFFVPDRPGVRRNPIRAGASIQTRKSGYKVKYKTRKVDGGMRVWRVE